MKVLSVSFVITIEMFYRYAQIFAKRFVNLIGIYELYWYNIHIIQTRLLLSNKVSIEFIEMLIV